MKKKPEDIISMVRKHFPISAVEIEEFIDNTEMPDGYITSKTSTVRSEDLVDCVNSISVEVSEVNNGRGLLLGCYLFMIKECQQSKDKTLNAIGKEHLELFKKLNL
jgi:hypothetical protein